MSTLVQLTAVRSQLALGLEAYLQAFVEMTAWPVVRFPGVRVLADVYLPPDVISRSELDADALARRQAADERGEFGHAEERVRRVAWAEERSRVERAVVLGRPGEGKTALTQMSCRAVATESLTTLLGREQPLGEIPIPIWVRSEDIVAALASLERQRDSQVEGEDRPTLSAVQVAVRQAAERTIRACLKTRHPEAREPPAGPAVRHVVDALERSSTWLFIDALDERPSGADVAAALAPLAELACHIVLTGRPYGYERGELPFRADQPVTEFELAPLAPTQQQVFIDEKWFTNQPADAARLRALLDQCEPLRDLATNGLLLTLLCATVERHRLDPVTTRRVHLYALAVRDGVRRLHKPAPIPDNSVELEQRLLVLADTAWALFQAHPAEKVFTFREWDKAMRTACGTQEVAEIATFATALRTDLVEAGLLVSPSTGRWMFLPRTFFEYLAAVGLVNQAAGSREVVAALGPRLSDPPSREVVLLAIAHLGVIVRDPRLASAVVAALLAWETDPAGHGVALVGEAVAEIVPAGAALVGLSKTARDQLVSTLLRDMRDDARVKAVERVACGDALAKLGDTRFHQEDLWCLPNDDHLGFLRVPAGPFPMGSDKSSDREALDDEVPQHPVVLAAFYIARWPVTVAQFQLFMKATGRTRELPSDWESDQGPANHPVVSVKWHDGQAYAKWLTKQMREAATRKNLPDPLLQLFAEPEPWRVRLASEAEWEKAARGSDGWTYPWGNEADPERANYRETGIGDTSAVGCFRGGGRKMAEDAPLGVEELAGNVWEWTRSKWVERYPYVPGDGREEEGGDEPRVLRGGSFLINRRFVRAANRDLIAPVDRSYNFGCRVVLSPFDFDL